MNVLRSIAQSWLRLDSLLRPKEKVETKPVSGVQPLGRFIDAFEGPQQATKAKSTTPFTFRDGFDAAFTTGGLQRDTFSAGGRPLVDLSGGVKAPVPEIDSLMPSQPTFSNNGFLASIDDFVVN